MEREYCVEIAYKNKSLEKICTDASAAVRKYGFEMAVRIRMRIGEMMMADNVEQMILYRVGRCHMLKGDREGKYAVDLIHPYRLVFRMVGEDIQIARIEEIVDYH